MDRLTEAKNVVDAALVGGGATAPFWLDYLQTGSSIVVALGAVIVIALRIAILWRELRAKKIDRS